MKLRVEGGNLALMLSVTLIAILSLCCQQVSGQQGNTPNRVGTPAYKLTTIPVQFQSTPRTTQPTRAPTTIFRGTTNPAIQKGAVQLTTRYAASGSSIPRCSVSVWAVVLGTTLYTLLHKLYQ